MKTDTELRVQGMQILIKALGEVDAERFVMLMNREPFDYTQWRQSQWLDENVESLAAKARALR